MKQLRRVLRPVLPLLAVLCLASCRHALQIEGRGDIVEVLTGVRGCSLEEYQNGNFPNCTDNDVSRDEDVVYRGLPRPGWRFSHWDGFCSNESQGDDCALSYKKKSADAWDALDNGKDMPPLVAVFVEEGNTLDGTSYISTQLGAEGNDSFAALLDALFTESGTYRYTTQQAGTRQEFDRTEYLYSRSGDGLLLTGNGESGLVSGGAATRDMDFLTLVDTDSSDGDISVTYLAPEQTNASAAAFVGTYYCGHISTWAPGYARFFRAVMGGNGTGALEIISDRFGNSGTAGIGYTVDSDGTTLFDYKSFGYRTSRIEDLRLAGSLSPDGSVFIGTQLAGAGNGIGICLRASANQTLGTVAGSYFGAWMNLQAVTAVTDILVDPSGQTAESVLRDSLGGREYFLEQNFLLVMFDGRLETQSTFGAVSADNRIMFIVDTNGGNSPRIAVYIRKT